MSKMSKWKLLKILTEGEPIEIEGVSLIDNNSKIVECEPIEVQHPIDSYRALILRPRVIEQNDKKILFAVDELSAGVYCYYSPC